MERLTMNTLVSLLSARTGDTKRETEDFIRELFAVVSEELQKGDSVKIRDLGMFKIVNVEPRKSVDVNTGSDMMIPGHRKVNFIPSKDLAGYVNAPFDMFTSMEVTEDMALRIQDNPDSIDEVASETDNSIDEEYVEEPAESIKEPGSIEPTPIIEEEENKEPAPLYEVKEEPVDDAISDTTDINDTSGDNDIDVNDIDVNDTTDDNDSHINDPEQNQTGESDVKLIVESIPEDVREADIESISSTERVSNGYSTGRKWYWLGVGSGILLSACALLAVWGISRYVYKNQPASVKSEKVVAGTETITEVKQPVITNESKEDNDSNSNLSAGHQKSEAGQSKKTEIQEETVPTAPSDKKVYDTITTTRYLTTMAKAHYGNYNLWPYIYMENQSFLGHPDRIRPGTKVVIPPLSKYGIKEVNETEIAKAKKLGLEIYGRYK